MTTKLKYILPFALSLLSAVYTPIAQAGFFDDFVAGIANATDTKKMRLRNYEEVQDKPLVDSFYFLAKDGSEHKLRTDINLTRIYSTASRSPNSIGVMTPFKKGSLSFIKDEMRAYSYDPLDDIGLHYVKFAYSRGNTVKQYSPLLGAYLNARVDQNFKFKPAPNIQSWSDLDNVLVEYAPNGTMVSIMRRSHQAIENLVGHSSQHTNFSFGKPLMRQLENVIPKRVLDDSFQRIVTPPGSEAAAVSPEALVQPGKVSPEKKIQLLQQLNELKKSGVLSDAEFLQEKSKILSE